MSILKSVGAGSEALKVTRITLLAKGFFHPKTKDEDGVKVKDKEHIWVNRNHLIDCIGEELSFHLEIKEKVFAYPIENELDLNRVLLYCSDEKKFRYLRRTMMDDPRTFVGAKWVYPGWVKTYDMIKNGYTE